MKTYYSILLITISVNLSLFCHDVKSQDVPSYDYNQLAEKLNFNNVKETTYKMVLFNNTGENISSIRILERSISKDYLQSKPAVKITERSYGEGSLNKVTAYLDPQTFLPLFVESATNDTVKSTYEFKDDRIISTDIQRNSQEVLEYEAGTFLSYNFSEIIAANNFRKRKKIIFKTITPGRPANVFSAERIGEKKFELPGEAQIDCWLLEFHIITSTGEKQPAGFRYIDKKSGKILFFKTNLESENYFTYQVLMLD